MDGWTREAERDGDEEGGRTEAIGRMAREELEAGLGRGRYAVGAEWDEGSMVHAIRRFGGQTIGWRFGTWGVDGGSRLGMYDGGGQGGGFRAEPPPL